MRKRKKKSCWHLNSNLLSFQLLLIKIISALKAFFQASSMWVQSVYFSRTRPCDRLGKIPRLCNPPPNHRSVPHGVDRPVSPKEKKSLSKAIGKATDSKWNPHHAKKYAIQLTAKIVPTGEQDNREEAERSSREPLHDPPLPPTQHRLTASRKSLDIHPEKAQGCRTQRMCFGGTLGSLISYTDYCL